MTAAREANVPTAYGIRRVSPVTTSTFSNATPSVSATICAKAVWWPCPWVVSPVATLTLPEVSTCTCAPSYGPDAGALHVAGQPDADPSPLGRHLCAEGGELVPADELLELLQRGRVVARVVLQLAAVLEDQPLVVGELVGLDEVGRPHLRAVLAQRRRDRVHRALHDEAALRPARRRGRA